MRRYESAMPNFNSKPTSCNRPDRYRDRDLDRDRERVRERDLEREPDWAVNAQHFGWGAYSRESECGTRDEWHPSGMNSGFLLLGTIAGIISVGFVLLLFARRRKEVQKATLRARSLEGEREMEWVWGRMGHGGYRSKSGEGSIEIGFNRGIPRVRSWGWVGIR